MTRKIKNPVVVTLSKTLANKLVDVLLAAGEDRLAALVGDEVEEQATGWVTLELARKDGLAIQREALNDIQMGGVKLTARTHDQIEQAFFAAWAARLRRSVGE